MYARVILIYSTTYMHIHVLCTMHTHTYIQAYTNMSRHMYNNMHTCIHAWLHCHIALCWPQCYGHRKQTVQKNSVCSPLGLLWLPEHGQSILKADHVTYTQMVLCLHRVSKTSAHLETSSVNVLLICIVPLTNRQECFNIPT